MGELECRDVGQLGVGVVGRRGYGKTNGHLFKYRYWG